MNSGEPCRTLADDAPANFKTAGRHPWRCRRTDRSRRAPPGSLVDRGLVQTAQEQRSDHGDGAADVDSDRLAPGDLAPLRLRLHRGETPLDLVDLLDDL